MKPYTKAWTDLRREIDILARAVAVHVLYGAGDVVYRIMDFLLEVTKDKINFARPLYPIYSWLILTSSDLDKYDCLWEAERDYSEPGSVFTEDKHGKRTCGLQREHIFRVGMDKGRYHKDNMFKA